MIRDSLKVGYDHTLPADAGMTLKGSQDFASDADLSLGGFGPGLPIDGLRLSRRPSVKDLVRSTIRRPSRVSRYLVSILGCQARALLADTLNQRSTLDRTDH